MSLTPLKRLSVFFESALHKVEAIAVMMIDVTPRPRPIS